jgi:hypothetical protein
LAPFYDSCDGNYPFKKIPEDEIIINKSFSEKVYDYVIDEDSFNGFEIATFFPIGVQEFKSLNEFKEEIFKSFQKKDWYKNLGMAVSLFFDFIVVISFSILIISFTKKIKMLNRLALINTIFILLTFFKVLCHSMTLKQLKTLDIQDNYSIKPLFKLHVLAKVLFDTFKVIRHLPYLFLLNLSFLQLLHNMTYFYPSLRSRI